MKTKLTILAILMITACGLNGAMQRSEEQAKLDEAKEKYWAAYYINVDMDTYALAYTKPYIDEIN